MLQFLGSKQSFCDGVSRRNFLASVSDTDTVLLPIHFPTPTAGTVTADGKGFRYRFKR